MAFELLTEVPSLLLPKHVVHFSAGWPDKWAEKYFRVLLAQQFEYEVHRILSPSQHYDIEFSAPAGGGVSAAYISLMPMSGETLYEILMGLKGLPVVYPRYNNEYYLKLETTGVYPKYDDSALRYLGYYDQTHSPYYAPKLREYTVKDVSPPQLRLYNNMSEDERLVLRFVMNRCKMAEVAEADLTDQEKRLAREIKHFSVFTW